MPVIDNERTVLLDELRKFLPHTERASIAVGYFFISGFAEIMDSLGRLDESDNPDHVLRLLISPTTDRRTAEAMLEANESRQDVEREQARSMQPERAVQGARDDIRRRLHYMPQSERDARAVQKLIGMIRRGKVKIKVYTQGRLHAKAYIFELDPGQTTRGVAIVGSSNLSISGIREHAELNMQTTHAGDHVELLEWFDRHWDDPACQEFTEEAAEILESSWAGRNYAPSDVYGKAVLHEHADDFDDYFGDSGLSADIELFDFQRRAVAEAIRKLDDYGGVIIADVVGTGKSYEGSAVLKYLKEYRRAKPLVICPPHLKDMWEGLLKDFQIYGEVESRYKIGMDDDVLRNHTHCDAILVDESHNFRHHTTQAYRALLRFMEDKADEAKMIMLTATPISNTVHDLRNQLKLFPPEGLEQIPVLGSATLDEYFKGLEKPGMDMTPDAVAKVQDLLRHVLIRRVRSHIIEAYAKADGNRHYIEQAGERRYFPKRNLQNPEEYDADKVYNNSFGTIESYIGALRLARYAPGKYVKDEYRADEKYQKLVNMVQPLVGIVRTSLLKRMESSIAAFASSVENYQNGSKEFKAQLLKGRVPIGKEFQDLIYKKITEDDYDAEEKMEGIRPEYEAKAFDTDRWIADITQDIGTFASIKGVLSDKSKFTEQDDKLHRLLDIVRARDEKILIFSESAVTARYISDYIAANLPDRKIAQIDSKQDQRTKTLLVKRFDPVHNRGDDVTEGDELDILVSTDVLAEGVNLHASRTVINYDFHWNPVRLIQRVGRIDRIGSVHATIDIFNFLPTLAIDRHLSLKERVAAKIRTIRRIIGADQKILEATENIDESAVMEIYNPAGDDTVLDPKLRGGLLDIGETESQKQADRIRGDSEKRGYFERLPLGLRATAGSGRLLVACEAEETIRTQKPAKGMEGKSAPPLQRRDTPA